MIEDVAETFCSDLVRAVPLDSEVNFQWRLSSCEMGVLSETHTGLEGESLAPGRAG